MDEQPQSVTDSSIREFFLRFMKEPPKPMFWYTTLNRIKYVCRMNGLSIKQTGRIVKRVADGRMTANQVLDHLSSVRKAS